MEQTVGNMRGKKGTDAQEGRKKGRKKKNKRNSTKMWEGRELGAVEEKIGVAF